MAILAFIIGTAAAVMAVLGWGLVGAAGAKIKRLELAVDALEKRLAAVEGG